MDLAIARDLAWQLMRQHGLHDWAFRFDHARRRFGCCNYTHRTLSLSRHLVLLNGEAEVRDTLLHEIAHALCPHKEGHGPLWQATCRKIGARPVRCYTDATVRSPPKRAAPFEIGCEVCQWWADRHRRTDRLLHRRLICKKCRGPIVLREKRRQHPTWANIE